MFELMMEQLKGQQCYKEEKINVNTAAVQFNTDATRICSHCHTVNETDALFCEECGTSLFSSHVCPNCHHPLNVAADYCESCHTYVDTKHCSFCGANISDSDSYCPECGASRQGIICPVCHTKSMFSYCPVCAIPLTQEAEKQRVTMQQKFKWKEMEDLAEELDYLMKVNPVDTVRQIERKQANEELCHRVRLLLNETIEKKPKTAQKEKTSDALAREIALRREDLQRLLDKCEIGEMENPVQTRNYIMACKPPTTLLGWKCNFKHVVHSSPCACSCPQMGGKWIVLNGEIRIEDDI